MTTHSDSSNHAAAAHDPHAPHTVFATLASADVASANERAAAFRALHVPGKPLLLANVWDPASARLAQHAGAQAIATTSAGLAWAAGVADGNALGRDDALAAAARIVNSVSLPVSIDVEGGYGPTLGDVEQTIAAALAVGAIGINIEDGALSSEDFAERIAAARRTADRLGVALVINARTDVFLRGRGTPSAELIAEALVRAERYAAAGADSLFVPGAATRADIAALVEGSPLPLNVMVGPGALPVAELAELGVARVSLGSATAEAAYDVFARAATELLTAGGYDSLQLAGAGGAGGYGGLNALMA